MKVIIREEVEQRKRPIRVFYHGTNSEIEAFSLDFVGKGNDQYGPGIYLTDSIEIAKGYGKNVYEVRLFSASRIRKAEMKRLPADSWLFVKAKRAEGWEDDAMNWDEDPRRGLRMAVQSMLQSAENFGDCIQQLWIEFFKGEEKKFCEVMSSTLDGLFYVAGNKGEIFVTLFNVQAIKSVKLIQGSAQ